MTSRKLNSDQLGKKGESRFPELCVDAGLTPNGSTWDRRGWDFIVDWPHAAGALAYDSRPAPMSCLVQLKTVWSSTKTITLRLSSAEFIAKDSRPTFIYVLRVEDDLSFTDARIAHLEGDFLAFILKELRKARLDKSEPNGVEIRVPLTKWFSALPANGQALRAAIEESVGPFLGAYTKEKQRQLRELGYENGGQFLTTTFMGNDVEHMVDAFLGLRRIDAVSTSAVDRRFDLDVPIPQLNLGPGTVEIKPQPRDVCTVTATRVSDGMSFEFRGKAYGVPGALLADDQMRMLIRTDLFDLKLRGQVPQPCDFTMNLTISTDPRKIGVVNARALDWANFYGFLAAFGEQSLQISIKFSKASQPIVGVLGIDSGKDARRWRRPARWAAIAADVLSRAGWPGTKIRIQDIGDVGPKLDILAAMLDDPTALTSLSFTTELMPDAANSESLRMLYFDRFRLGQHCIAYAVEVELAGKVEENKIVWVGGTPKFRDLKRLKPTTSNYDRYVESVRKSTGIRSYFAADFEEAAPSQ